MPFPFINSPFPEWISTKLKLRDFNKIKLNYLKPFVFLSSGALVSGGGKTYQGCVISDHFKAEERYQRGPTFIGYDLAGTKIETIDEVDRNVSTPIIESLEIDTDGGNNTLKTARLEIRVFTLKQLDMFDLFFLRAGENVVLEYGHIDPTRLNLFSPGFIKSTKEIMNGSFLSGVTDCNTFADKFVLFQSPNPEKYKAAREKYLNLVRDAYGDYDFWTAKVLNFNTTYEASSDTYKISLEISSGNELQLWSTIKQNSRKGEGTDENAAENKYAGDNDFYAFINKLLAETNLPDEPFQKFLIDKGKDEYFNFGMINESDKDSKFSKTPYLSMRLIIDLMNKIEEGKQDRGKKIVTDIFIDDEKKDLIPINSAENLISITDHFIIPGLLPKFEISKTNKQVVANGKVDCKVNKKKFNVHEKPAEYTLTLKAGKLAGENDYKAKGYVGNLLNIFVNYNTFLSIYKESITFGDFYSRLLGIINEHMFGLCKLEIGSFSENAAANLTIIDKKLTMPPLNAADVKPHRFRIGPKHSSVIDFTYNLEMSNLMMAQTLYQNAEEKAKAPDTNQSQPNYDKEVYMNLSGTPNIDGFKSVDITQQRIDAELAPIKQRNTEKTKKTTATKKTAKEALKEVEKLTEAIQQKYVKFKTSKEDKKSPVLNLIFKDPLLVQSFMPKEAKPNTSALTYLECSVTIDGISGISCGQLFNIDGVPEIYNRKGFFQITNIKQSINQDGWRTTLEASFRYNTADDLAQKTELKGNGIKS